MIKSTESHPTADWIYEQVKKEIPKISLGTIYRNLNILQEMGEIRELNYGSDYSRFDGKSENHYHFTCLDCGQIRDLELEIKDRMNQQVSQEVEGQVECHRTEFYGYCAQCSAD